MRCLVLILCFFGFLQSGISQQQQVANDTTTVYIRHFSMVKINEYKAHPDFEYERVKEPSRSVWARFWNWFWQKIGEIMKPGQTGLALRYVLIALAVAVLVFCLLRLMGMNNAGLFGKSNKGDRFSYSVSDEDIHSINFDTAILLAVESRNFRLAVRLLYLQCLKQLTDRGLIAWQINKTNIAYVQELKGNAFQQDFRYLTARFEYNWYGDVTINETEFLQVRDQFDQFNKQLP